ncbi:DUF5384 family protein [Aeromonas veronii]|uniref:DUF5384 family protein n=1 Tax=Aeromonas veronii TaxID=654 RepID=UPI00330624F8|nr:DUF5384 family protein [Aeromonas veronii]
MNKYILTSLCFSLLAPTSMTYANSLQDQLSAIAQAESDGKARQEAKIAAEQAMRDKALLEERLKREREAANAARKRAQQLAAAEQRKAQQAAEAKALRKSQELERKEDKKREQSYEDQLRELQIAKMKLEIESQSKRTKREDDFIDAELKRENARTDVIQSDADANRAISTGARDLMQSEGKASETKAGKWFN